MENTCSFCKFWRHISDKNVTITNFRQEGEVLIGPYGECMKIKDNSFTEKAWVYQEEIFIEKGDTHYAAHLLGIWASAESCLMTKPDFGCNSYKGKD